MAKHRPRIINLLLLFLDGCGIAMSLLIILWLTTGEKLFFVNLFVNIQPAVYYALPFALFLVILLRSYRSLLFLAIPIIAFIFLYAPRFLPSPIEAAEGQELVLLSYNLQAGNHAYAVLDGIITRADADIISFQEVNRDMVDYLTTEWGDEYPHVLHYSSPYDTYEYTGRFFMSRFPILSYEMTRAPRITHLMYIRAELEISGESVVVYNVHLPSPRYTPVFDTSVRSASMTAMLERANEDSPVIFMGDFNMTDQTNDYHRISSRYQDSFALTSSGLGTSWPNARFANPLLGFLPAFIRIDYIFLSEEFAPQETRVLREGASDHFPLWARIILKL